MKDRIITKELLESVVAESMVVRTGKVSAELAIKKAKEIAKREGYDPKKGPVYTLDHLAKARKELLQKEEVEIEEAKVCAEPSGAADNAKQFAKKGKGDPAKKLTMGPNSTKAGVDDTNEFDDTKQTVTGKTVKEGADTYNPESDDVPQAREKKPVVQMHYSNGAKVGHSTLGEAMAHAHKFLPKVGGHVKIHHDGEHVATLHNQNGHIHTEIH